jgi:hypothetical protein
MAEPLSPPSKFAKKLASCDQNASQYRAKANPSCRKSASTGL